MSAPILWIFLPLIVAVVLLFIKNSKVVGLITGSFSLFLTLAAWLVPIDVGLSIGSLTIKIPSSFEILGRFFIISPADRSFLALIYGATLVWIIVAFSCKMNHTFFALGLAVTALLVAALAVKPFLYAALIIEMAVLITMPLLSSDRIQPGKGAIRFLIFQTIAMGFLLFSGWLLTGIEANPGDIRLVQQAAILIGLGFAFLLAIFPFHTWIPMLAEESNPITIGFILWVFPTTVLFFGLGFMDRYPWLREGVNFPITLTLAGVVMIVTSGLMAAFQKQLDRILGFAIIFENGCSLIAMALVGSTGMGNFFFLLIPRVLALITWGLSLTILKNNVKSLKLDNLIGIFRAYPFAATGIILANLSMAGLPLLAGFPAHQALWMSLAKTSLPVLFWVLLGTAGFFFSGVRTLARFSSPVGKAHWEPHETLLQRILLSISFITIFILGIFPQWSQPLWSNLPSIFSHLNP